MLDVRDLSIELGGTTIVSDITLTVGTREWVTIIGPNGAGKSTLLRAIGGALGYAGSIAIGGEPLARLSRRQRAQRVASVAQTPVVPFGMSVLDYVLLGRTPHIPTLGRESAADMAAVDSVLHQLDLGRFATRELETLSGGERQRVFLARALAQGAPLLLLDEPTSALDIGHQQDVLELVDELRCMHGLTVVTTMHDLSIAGEYADRMIMMAEGRIVAEGPPQSVLTEELLARHYHARVRIVPGEHGPLIVPVRRPGPPTSGSSDPAE